MATFYDLEQKAEALKTQLEQLERDKQTAIDQARADKLNDITESLHIAVSYRNQAKKAETESDRLLLYRYADEMESKANDLKIELGLISEQQINQQNNERAQHEQLSISRSINALLLKSIFSFVVFIFADYGADWLDQGFLSYQLKLLSSLLKPIAMALAGLWFGLSILLSFAPTYGFAGVKTDFSNLTPVQRIVLLASMLAVFVNLLSRLFADAN